MTVSSTVYPFDKKISVACRAGLHHCPSPHVPSPALRRARRPCRAPRVPRASLCECGFRKSFYSAECGSRVRRRWFWHGSPIPPTRHSLLSPPRRPHLRASSLRPPPPSAASSPSIYACASLLFSSLLFFSRRAVCWLLLLCLVLLRRLFYRSHMRYVAPCVPTRNQDRRQVATQSRRSCLRAPHPIPHFLLSSFAAAVAVAWRVVPSFLLPGRCVVFGALSSDVSSERLSSERRWSISRHPIETPHPKPVATTVPGRFSLASSAPDPSTGCHDTTHLLAVSHLWLCALCNGCRCSGTQDDTG